MAGALSGVRILDLSSVVLGPFAAAQLGDLGAEVIKVESLDGDHLRLNGPKRSPKMSGFFMLCNRNKRSIALNLKEKAGYEVFEKLLADADVVLHSNRESAARRLGIDYETLAKKNSRLIYCRVAGFGEGGPYANRPAFDDIIQALSGIDMLPTESGREPSPVPTIIADKTTSLYAVASIAAALYSREKTGKGQSIVVPMFETMTSFLMLEHLSGHAFDPPIAEMGYRSLLDLSRMPFKTADGYISFLPYRRNNLKTFLKIIGKEHLLEDPRLANTEHLAQEFQAVRAIIAPEIEKKTSAEWLKILGDEGDLAVSHLSRIQDLPNDPHLNAVGFWQRRTHPTEGALLQMAYPIKFSETPAQESHPAPRLGGNTREILAELGYGDADISKLLESGVALGS